MNAPETPDSSAGTPGTPQDGSEDVSPPCEAVADDSSTPDDEQPPTQGPVTFGWSRS